MGLMGLLEMPGMLHRTVFWVDEKRFAPTTTLWNGVVVGTVKIAGMRHGE
jgi:hypothetical protein